MYTLYTIEAKIPCVYVYIYAKMLLKDKDKTIDKDERLKRPNIWYIFEK